MTDDAKAFLHELDKFLARGDDASAEVAAVITALRSDDAIDPDSWTESDVKALTTIPIRRAALPLCAARADDRVAIAGSHGTRFMGFRSTTSNGLLAYPVATMSKHYGIHAEAAARVLGILSEDAPNTTS